MHFGAIRRYRNPCMFLVANKLYTKSGISSVREEKGWDEKSHPNPGRKEMRMRFECKRFLHPQKIYSRKKKIFLTRTGREFVLKIAFNFGTGIESSSRDGASFCRPVPTQPVPTLPVPTLSFPHPSQCFLFKARLKTGSKPVVNNHFH